MKDGNTKSTLIKVKLLRKDSQLENDKRQRYTVSLVDKKFDFDLSYDHDKESGFLIKLH